MCANHRLAFQTFPQPGSSGPLGQNRTEHKDTQKTARNSLSNFRDNSVQWGLKYLLISQRDSNSLVNDADSEHGDVGINCFLGFLNVQPRREKTVRSLTEVVGHLVGAVSKHPEENSLRVANSLASFIHSGCDENTSSVPALHEHIARHRHVLPAREHSHSQGQNRIE